MPIKISPSRCVDIDFSQATDGEVVVIANEDGRKLFLSVWTDPSGRKVLVFEPELFPQDISDHIDSAIEQTFWTEGSLNLRIKHGVPGESTQEFLERWFKERPLIAQSRSLYGQRAFDMIDVGETLYVALPYPADHTRHQWEATSPIIAIGTSTKEEAIAYMALQTFP